MALKGRSSTFFPAAEIHRHGSFVSLIVGDLKNIKRVIEDLYRLPFQEPAVPIRLGKILSREISGAHDHGSGNTLVPVKEIRLNSVHLRIDAPKVR